MNPGPPTLGLLRRGIDGLDDTLLLLLAARRRLVSAVAASKRRAGLPARDEARERRVFARGLGLARWLGLPPDLARGQLALVVGDGHRLQGMPPADVAMASMDADDAGGDVPVNRLLRWLPPPARWAPLLRAVPPAWQGRAIEAVVARLLDGPRMRGDLDFMAGRRLGIEVPDLGLSWVLELQDGRLRATSDAAEATVRGSATDLLLLAGRLEDADTLFFQRRLALSGDTELGLTARNLLDRLPWDAVPLAARILLHRGARLARDARAVHRGRA